MADRYLSGLPMLQIEIPVAVWVAVNVHEIVSPMQEEAQGEPALEL
jgi:hypothetical protein